MSLWLLRPPFSPHPAAEAAHCCRGTCTAAAAAAAAWLPLRSSPPHHHALPAGFAQHSPALTSHHLTFPPRPRTWRRPREDIADAKERAAAEEAANKESQRAAMARVTPASAQAAEPLFEAAYGFIQQAVANMSEEEAGKEIKQMKPTVGSVCGEGELWRGGCVCAVCRAVQGARCCRAVCCVLCAMCHACMWVCTARASARLSAFLSSSFTCLLSSRLLSAPAPAPQAEQDPSDPDNQTSVKQSLLINVSSAPSTPRPAQQLVPYTAFWGSLVSLPPGHQPPPVVAVPGQPCCALPLLSHRTHATCTRAHHMHTRPSVPAPLPCPAARQCQV